MMMQHRWTAVVTQLSLLAYFWTVFQVGRARGTSGIKPPAMTGDPVLERAVRVQSNTLEWLPIFLASLWLFAIYWSEPVAAGLGVVWIVGRLLYSAGYMADPQSAAPASSFSCWRAPSCCSGRWARSSMGSSQVPHEVASA